MYKKVSTVLFFSLVLSSTLAMNNSSIEIENIFGNLVVKPPTSGSTVPLDDIANIQFTGSSGSSPYVFMYAVNYEPGLKVRTSEHNNKVGFNLYAKTPVAHTIILKFVFANMSFASVLNSQSHISWCEGSHDCSSSGLPL